MNTTRMQIGIGALLWGAISGASVAQIRPPAFIGGVPGMAQFGAIQMQRHQARTLLYREALEELRKNPAAADVPECPANDAQQSGFCLRRPQPEAATPSSMAKADAPAKPADVEPAPAKAASGPAPTTTSLPVEGRRLAVLFGNNDYKTPIPPLETPITDVTRTAEILKSRFGFEAAVVGNAGKAKIIETLNRVAAEAAPEDSVLLFYAGHGYLMDDTKMGFWIPVDASVKTAANWISNTDISKLLAAIRARQLILVSDSCFSGSLTREQKITHSGTPKAEEVLRRRSVVVLSSGGEEPVSDEGKEGHSIFAYNLIKMLDSASGTTPGYEVWRTVHHGVKKEYEQEPQYGAVVSAGHAEGGEYLFMPR